MKFLIFIMLGFIGLNAVAQESEPLVIGEVMKMQSKILNEERILNVYLPLSYHQDSKKEYPVIYVLDGSIEEDFIHIVGVTQFITFPWINDMEEAIVVGVANVNRKRDYTYPTTYSIPDLNFPKEVDKAKFDFASSGQSASFIAFLENEAIPAITQNYRVTSNRTLIGQSLGGLLATEILIRHAHLFTNYLIVSPSLWWNNESLLEEELNFPATTKVYLTVGKEEPKIMVTDAKLLYKKLSKATNCEIVIFKIEKWADHGNILHDAVKKGLIQLNK